MYQIKLCVKLWDKAHINDFLVKHTKQGWAVVNDLTTGNYDSRSTLYFQTWIQNVGLQQPFQRAGTSKNAHICPRGKTAILCPTHLIAQTHKDNGKQTQTQCSTVCMHVCTHTHSHKPTTQSRSISFPELPGSPSKSIFAGFQHSHLIVYCYSFSSCAAIPTFFSIKGKTVSSNMWSLLSRST